MQQQQHQSREPQHYDAATLERIALGDCSAPERYYAARHLSVCRYCLERSQALGGHLMDAWQQTLAAHAAAQRQPNPAWQLWKRLEVPTLPARLTHGGAVAAAAALSLFLMTSPDLRHQLARSLMPPAATSGNTGTSTAPRLGSGEVYTASFFPEAARYPELPAGGPVLPAWQFKPVADRAAQRSVESAKADIPEEVLERFEPSRVARPRRFLPNHSVVDLAPPPSIRPHVQTSGYLIAQANPDELPPPRKSSKLATFFQRTGSGVAKIFR